MKRERWRYEDRVREARLLWGAMSWKIKMMVVKGETKRDGRRSVDTWRGEYDRWIQVEQAEGRAAIRESHGIGYCRLPIFPLSFIQELIECFRSLCRCSDRKRKRDAQTKRGESEENAEPGAIDNHSSTRVAVMEENAPAKIKHNQGGEKGLDTCH